MTSAGAKVAGRRPHVLGSGVWISAAPLDNQLDAGGYAYFDRSYPLSSIVTVEAPVSLPDGRSFVGWKLNGVVQPGTNPSFDVFISAWIVNIKAIYEPSTVKDRLGVGNHDLGNPGGL